MNTRLQAPRGTYDALPETTRRLRHIENTAHQVFGRFGYGEIRTPMFEFTDVFARTVGEATDIVSKEMYTFTDRGGEQLTLRPEGTAGVMRAFLEHKLKQQLPLKVYYAGAPMFRYERPQKGRFRQFHQLGCELLGVAEPWADVEVIAAGVQLLEALGQTDLVVHINTLGTAEDRAAYRTRLMEYFKPVTQELSAESQERLTKNPLRVLDSKQPEDQKFVPGAPKPVDVLCAESAAFYAAVKEGLGALGIGYKEVPTLVRGLDYYSHTVFEIHSTALGAQSQVLAGGRYDGLCAQMGGDVLPAVGFGAGMERLEMLLADLPAPAAPLAFVVMEPAGMATALMLAQQLRAAGHTVQVPLAGGSAKSQFRQADRAGASHVLILGAEELAQGTVAVKIMADGSQRVVPQRQLVDVLATAATGV